MHESKGKISNLSVLNDLIILLHHSQGGVDLDIYVIKMEHAEKKNASKTKMNDPKRRLTRDSKDFICNTRPRHKSTHVPRKGK